MLFEKDKSMLSCDIFGRAWVYDDEPDEIEVWEHALEPMVLGRRSGAEWAKEYLVESCSNKLREMLGIPPEGNFQVVFKGKMWGYCSPSHDCGDEWEDDFLLDDVHYEQIPDDFMKYRINPQPSQMGS